MIRVGRFVRATVAFLLIVMLMTAVSLLPGGGRAHADPVNTFSGILADQNGNPLSGTTVTLTNASGSAASAITGGDGSFSVSASPDVYYLTLASANTSGMNFMVRQSSAASGVNLTAGSVAQNLTLPVATVSYTAYTAQGAPDAGNLVTASSDTTPGSAVSLYPGDPGETYVHVANAATLTADTQGAGSFTSIVGANYTGGICDYTNTGAVIGCNATPLTVGSGVNSVSVPHAPLPHYTFSGVLADQHGNALVGVSLSLSDADGNVTSTTTGVGGAFSLPVVSGMYRISNLSGTNVDGFYLLGLKQTGTPSINLTAGNVTQNLTLPVTTVSYTAYDTQGYVNATGTVDAGSAYTSSSLISLYPGDPGEWASVNTGPINPSAQGTGTFNTLVGVVYAPNTICDFTASNTLIGCNTAQFTATSGTNKVVIPIPPTPANLTAASPTSEPSLSWTAVASASSYNVYRDGVKIATTTTASFVDNNVSGGAHTYYVTAVDGVGDESTPSNTVTVTVNLIAPTLGTPTFTPNPVIQGQPTTVTVTVQGNLYGIIGGEYYIGNTDPGQGHGIAMTYSNGTLSAVLSGLALGSQTIHIRAQNSVGWSSLASGTVTVVKPVFSGTLTDSNGVALVGVTIILRDAQGDSATVTTTTGGAFSVAVVPGMYYIYQLSGNNIDGIYSFLLRQSSTSASLNLVTGNVTQNLVLPVATLNYTAYNAQDYVSGMYVSAQTNSGTATPISLYAGDPGESIVASTSRVFTNNGTGSFKLIVGATYAGTSWSNGICDFANSTDSSLVGCVASYTVTSGTSSINVPHNPAPRNTLSGMLTDSNGVALAGVTITLHDAYNNQVTATTGTDGSYSIAVEPGMYYISSVHGVNVDGIASFTLSQSSSNPSIDLTTGNIMQNLVLPVATINATLYNTQDYLDVSGRLVTQGATGLTSLYAGDPGMSIVIGSVTFNADASGLASFKSIVGATYTNGLCSYSQSTSPSVRYGCMSYVVVSGTNTISVPHAPAPRNTFSGVLTDSNGVVLAGVIVKLNDAYGNVVSTTTGSDGSFSLSVEPGVYALTISGTSAANIDNIGAFTVQQFTPGIDLTASSVTQNLVLPVAAMSVTLYNAQGYVNSNGTLNSTGASGTVSLYAGDPGEFASISSVSRTANSSGLVTFNTILGVAYSGTGSSVGSPVVDSDGTIWYVYGYNSGSGATVYTLRSTTAGVTTSYTISSGFTGPGQLVVAGGSVFYTETATGSTDSYIGRRDPSGVITNYDITSYRAGFHFGSMVAGPDGNIWFYGVGAIGRLNISTGAVTFYGLGVDSYNGPGNLVAGPDGNLYYNLRSANSNYLYIFRLNPSTGVTTTFQSLDSYADIDDMAIGPNNTLWAWDYYYNRTYEYALTAGAPAGTFTIPGNGLYGGYGSVLQLVAGPDGNEWLVETGGPAGVTRIAKITPSGVLTEYAIASGVGVSSLFAGPDGAMWFVTGSGFGRITTSGSVSLYSVPSSATNGLCSNNATTSYGCTTYTPVSGANAVDVPRTPASRNTFSGVLADQNGNTIAGVTVALTDAYNNSVSTVTASDGSYSIAVEPGMYRLSLNASNNAGTDDGLYNFSMSQSGTPSINLTTGNIAQNLTIPVATVHYTASAGYIATVGSASNVSLYAGDPGEVLSNISTISQTAQYGFLASSSNGSFNTIVGTVYSPGTRWVGSVLVYGSICWHAQTFPNKSYTCIPGSLTIADTSSYSVIVGTPPAPTNLHATSPTPEPVLGWNTVSGAVGYRVYRDGSLIGTTSTTTFTDNNVASGTHAYYVVAFDSTTGVGLSSSTLNVTVNLVTPTLGTPTFSIDPVAADQTTVVTVSVTGNLSGVTGGEYFIGTDPGQGNGTAMTYSNGVLTATLSGLLAGNQTVSVRAHNSAGWSAVSSAILHVIPTAPTNLTATSPTTEPSLSWTAVSGVTSYDVYRDGIKIGSTTSTSYLDTTAPEGTHTYYVKSVDDAGDASAASNTISVEIEGVDQAVAYYTVNDGSTFSKESTASASGVSTQTDNPDGTVTVSANNPTGYADSGFTTWTGTLGSLPEFTVTGSGDPFGLNIWFDTDNDGSFFSWDGSGALTSLGGDTYGISSGSTAGSLTVNGDTSFSMMDDGQSYTLAQLIAGDDLTSGINANTVVTIWIGVNTNSGSTSATIDSIGALQQV